MSRNDSIAETISRICLYFKGEAGLIGIGGWI